jgi:site-specific DNA recombinase
VIERIENLSNISDNEITVVATSNKENDIKEIKALLVKADKKMQKQIEAFEDELITKADLKAAKERVEKERKELNSRLMQIQNQKPDLSGLRKKAGRLLEQINGVDRKEAKFAMTQLISRIELRDGEFKVVWLT